MKQRLSVGLILLIMCSPTYSLILSEKVDVNKRISRASSYILTKQFDKAEEILTDIKYTYSDTEFAPIADFHLATIYFEKKNWFKARFHIEEALSHPNYDRLTQNYMDRIAYFNGMIQYKLEYFDNALTILKPLSNRKTLPNDKVNLYISDILTKQKRQSEAKHFYSLINETLLSGYELDLYHYLADKILWQSIDTTTIAYKDPNVSAILIDKDVIYIGTWNGSLICYNYILEESKFYTRNEVICENIRTLYNDGRYIYVGTQEGLSILDKRSQRWSSPNELKGASITSVTEFGGKIFIGTLGSGVVEFDKTSMTFSNKSQDIMSNVVSLNPIGNILFVCTYNGNVYRYENGEFVRDNALSQRENPVVKIISSGDEIWLATYGRGIVRYNTKTKKSQNYTKKNAGIADDFILCAERYQDKIFFGTLGKGIFIYNLTTSGWETFRFSDKYFGLDINTLSIYNNSIFIGTLGEGVLIKALNE
ncbi:MAG: hypothetical protein J6Y01_01100 [Spirochaetales bacterium]|nr:hypothetical protein [Spirochaetales bacterium]